MPKLLQIRDRSVLAPAELSALGALLTGGGTVSEFQVSLLDRVLHAARDWYRHQVPGTGPGRAARARWARAARRVRRHTPFHVPAADPGRLAEVREPRELLDDHGVLLVALIAAVAWGSTDPVGAEEPAGPGGDGPRATLLRFPRVPRSPLPGAA